MKVRTKIGIGFMFVVILLWVTSFFAQHTYTKMQGEFESVEEDILPGVIAVSEMEILANQMAYDIVIYINTGQEADRQAVLLSGAHLRTLGQEYLTLETHRGPEARQEAEALLVHVDAFAASAAGLVNLKEMEIGIPEVLLGDMVYPLFPIMLEQIEEQKAARLEELAIAKEAAREAYASGVQLLWLTAGLITILAVAAAVFISRSIVKPLRALHEGTEIIGQGNLNYQVGTKARDEIGQLSRAFDRMTEKLRSSTTSIESLNKEIADRKKIEEELQQSQRFSSTLLQNSPNPVLVLDPDASVRYVNPAFEKLTGFSLFDILGVSLPTPGGPRSRGRKSLPPSKSTWQLVAKEPSVFSRRRTGSVSGWR